MSRDFFISHAGKDAAWAEWVAWQLLDAGYSVEVDLWDWAAGENFILKMEEALASATGVVALLSPAFFEAGRYTVNEWTATLAGLTRRQSRLIPIEVQPVTLPRLIGTLVVPAIHGVTEETARNRLIQAVSGPTKPTSAPPFPRQVGRPADAYERPRLPGVLPSVSNLPPRNAVFVGRAGTLQEIRERMLIDRTIAVQALNGMGGVGKTQIALEYAYQFASDYNAIWWFDAEQSALLGEQYAAFAVALGLVSPDTSATVAYRALRRHLREHHRWLILFDNTNDPGTIRDWLVPGAGHTIITSRENGWQEIGHSTVVDVLSRGESVTLVRKHHAGINVTDAHRIADTVGDLPLALVQASSFLRQSGMPVAEYISVLSGHSAELLREGKPATYSRSLASAIEITMDRLAVDDPAAAEVACLCAFLAPEPISPDWLINYAKAGPVDLTAAVATTLVHPSKFRSSIGRMASLGLVRIGNNTMIFHRLVQAVLRDGGGEDNARRRARVADNVMLGARPPDPDDPTTWPSWSALLPHIIIRANGNTASAALRELAVDGAWFLLDRGDTQSGKALAASLYEDWLCELGPDDASTLSAANRTAWGLRDLGSYDAARDLDADTFVRRCRVLGRDHVDTLRSASNLAADYRRLGDIAAAFRIDCDTFSRRSAILGWNDPETLRSSVNLGADLRGLGKDELAARLHAEARRRLRGAVGDNHPDTLVAAGNLAADMRAVGQVAAAMTIDADTYDRQRSTLGEDHPDTLRSAMNLRDDHRLLGHLDLAIKIGSDLLQQCRRVRGEAHEDTMRAASDLIADLHTIGQHDRANQLETETGQRPTSRASPPA